MNLTTVKFALFIVLLLIAYYAVPYRHQWKCILLSNFVFLWFSGTISVLAVFLIAGISYTAALCIGKQNDLFMKEKKRLTSSKKENRETVKKLKDMTKQRNTRIFVVGIVLMISFWFNAKNGKISLFMPLAISYYTFIAVSYLADVCQGKYKPETNFWKYLTFLSFFPQLTEGPFSRYEILGTELFQKHSFSISNIEKGILRMLYGYIKKLLLADSLWIMISYMLELNYPNSWATLFLILLLPLQQYADFSGCMDIVIGASRLFGVSLAENFRFPIFSKSIDEVWRRWHITLGAFCKDYIFYPVALNKKINRIGKRVGTNHKEMGRRFPALIALICVWTFMGVWHGLAWKYLIWGWMNLAVIASSLLMERQYARLRDMLHIRQNSRWYIAFCMFRTYLLFGIMEYMADGSSAGWAIRGWKGLLSASTWSNQLLLDIRAEAPETFHPLLCILLTILVVTIDVLKEKKILVSSYIQQRPFAVKCLIYLIMIYLIILFIPTGIDINSGFAYANF